LSYPVSAHSSYTKDFQIIGDEVKNGFIHLVTSARRWQQQLIGTLQGYDKYYQEVICVLKSTQIIVKSHNEIVVCFVDMNPTLAWYSPTICLALYF